MRARAEAAIGQFIRGPEQSTNVTCHYGYPYGSQLIFRCQLSGPNVINGGHAQAVVGYDPSTGGVQMYPSAP